MAETDNASTGWFCRTRNFLCYRRISPYKHIYRIKPITRFRRIHSFRLNISLHEWSLSDNVYSMISMRLRKNPIVGSKQRFFVVDIREKQQTGSTRPLRTLTKNLEYDSLWHAPTIPWYGFRTSTHNKFHSWITRFLLCTARYAATILPRLHENRSTHFALEWTRGCIRVAEVERTRTWNRALCEPGVEAGTFMCNREKISTKKQVVRKSFPHTCDIQIWINLPLHPSLQCCVISHSVIKPPHCRYTSMSAEDITCMDVPCPILPIARTSHRIKEDLVRHRQKMVLC